MFLKVGIEIGSVGMNVWNRVKIVMIFSIYMNREKLCYF